MRDKSQGPGGELLHTGCPVLSLFLMTEQKLSSIELINLVKRAQKGDAAAFGEVYDALVAPIYRYIYYRVSTRVDAEDLTEMVFLRGWEKLKQYAPQKKYPFSAWLFRIAHNIVIDYYRDKPKREALELDEMLIAENREANPTLATEMYFDQRELRMALRKLPDVQQQVLILKFVNGFDNDGIAKIIGKSSAAVRVIQFRALTRMKELLEGQTTFVRAFQKA